MSVQLASVLDELGLPHLSVVDDHPGYGVIAILAGKAREQQQIIVRDPTAREPAHAHVIGKKKSKGIRRGHLEGHRVLKWPSVPKDP